MNKKKIISIFTISIVLIFCLVLCSHQAIPYYNWGEMYTNSLSFYERRYGLGLGSPVGLYGGIDDLKALGSILGNLYDLGGSYGLYGIGGLDGLSDLGGLHGSYGLNGLYSIQNFGNSSGFHGLDSPYELYAQGSLFGLNCFDGLASFYGPGSSYEIYGLSRLYASLGSGVVFGRNSQGALGSLGQLHSAVFTRAPAVVTSETWAGQWSGLQVAPLSALPAAGGATAGPMTLALLEDPVFQTVSGFAVLEFNTLLQGGIELSGVASYALLSLNGILQTALVPGGLLNVSVNCIQDTPTHMTGDYKVYDFIGGYYRIYESGTFEMELLPTLIL